MTVQVAHEGNPRFTDDLVLVGTLDGNATLLIQFPTETEGVISNPPEVAEREGTSSAGCTDVFTEVIPFTLTPHATIGNIFQEPSTEIKVHSAFNCYGIKYAHGYLFSYAQPYDLAVVRFNTCWTPGSVVIDGGGRTGIAFNILPGAHFDRVTCYGVVIDDGDGTVKLVKWVNQSLSDYGTILASIPNTLAADTGIECGTRAGATVDTLMIYDVFGSSLFEVEDLSIPKPTSSNPSLFPAPDGFSTGLLSVGGGLDSIRTWTGPPSSFTAGAENKILFGIN